MCVLFLQIMMDIIKETSAHCHFPNSLFSQINFNVNDVEDESELKTLENSQTKSLLMKMYFAYHNFSYNIKHW